MSSFFIEWGEQKISDKDKVLLVLYCSQFRVIYHITLYETSISKHFHIIHSFKKYKSLTIPHSLGVKT